MKRIPSTQALRALDSFTRHGSVWKAADELNLTRSAVSHQLRLLERDLGFQLLSRVGTKIELTEQGLGYALDDFLSARGDAGLKLLRQMFAKSTGFRLAVEEVEKSLFLADMGVAERYAELVPTRNDAERLFALIRHEHRRTSKVVLELTGGKMLCERFQNFRRRFERIRPMVDQANLWQVQLLRQTREEKGKDALNMPLLMTMNCVAAGLGWTG